MMMGAEKYNDDLMTMAMNDDDVGDDDDDDDEDDDDDNDVAELSNMAGFCELRGLVFGVSGASLLIVLLPKIHSLTFAILHYVV